jgi:uncharacterized protein (TIGR02646 family)
MIHIQKADPIEEFQAFRQSVKPTKWEEIHSYRNGEVYRLTRDHILSAEQHGIGGYTERPLPTAAQASVSEAAKVHIDHFRKRALFAQQIFAWENLIVEDRNLQYGACYKDSVVNRKADYDRLLNPVVDYPERMLTYLANGRMIVRPELNETDRDKAQFTIDTFHLNHPALCKKREAVIRDVMNFPGLTDDEIRQAMEQQGFPTVVEWALAARK